MTPSAETNAVTMIFRMRVLSGWDVDAAGRQLMLDSEDHAQGRKSSPSSLDEDGGEDAHAGASSMPRSSVSPCVPAGVTVTAR